MFRMDGIKLLHIADMHNRHNGRLFYSTGKKLNNGFLKNNVNVLQISDRDFLQTNIFNLKKNKFLSNIKDTISNFNPKIILFGHVDSLTERDFFELKNQFKNIIFSQYFVDTLDPKFEKIDQHKKRFFLKYQICDTNFITTNPYYLDFTETSKTFFIPNPCDESIDILDNYNFENLEYDLFFALSHGQHRGILKKGYEDERVNFINNLKLKNINTNFFGIKKNPVWGKSFFEEMSKSKMGLNYNRGEPIKYYSSDRISSLIGNGLLTFLQKNYSYEDFFEEDKEVVYFDNHEDLSDKIQKYSSDNKSRMLIAKNGKKKYFDYFENILVARYMLEKILNLNLSNKRLWMK